jgi:hypothetical protein
MSNRRIHHEQNACLFHLLDCQEYLHDPSEEQTSPSLFILLPYAGTYNPACAFCFLAFGGLFPFLYFFPCPRSMRIPWYITCD